MSTVEVTGDARPGFCGNSNPCTVALQCKQRVDSAARRCFPADPAANPPDLDDFYRCDGDRPDPNS